MNGGGDNGPRSRVPRSLKIGLGIAISVFFLWLSFRTTEVDEVWRYAASASLPILSLVLVTKAGALLAASVRSTVLLRELHGYPFWRVVKSLLVAFVGNAILPLRAGEVMRVAYLSRYGDGEAPPTSCVAVLVVERLLDVLLLSLLLTVVVLAGLVELSANTLFFASAGLVAGAVIAMWWIARRPERAIGLSPSRFIATKVERFSNGLAAVSRANGLARVGLATLGYWAFQALSIRIWFWAFGVELAWYAPLVVIVFVAFGAALPSAPGYVGTYHFFAISGLTLLGVGREEAVAIAIVGHFLAVGPLTIAGIAVLSTDLARGAEGSADDPREHLSVEYHKKALPTTSASSSFRGRRT